MSRAGRLKDRCTFQKEVKTADGAGGNTATWADQFTVWGDYRPENGMEDLDADRLAESAQSVLIIRSSTQAKTIEPAWRVQIGGESFQIRSQPTDRFRSGLWLEMRIDRGVAS